MTLEEIIKTLNIEGRDIIALVAMCILAGILWWGIKYGVDANMEIERERLKIMIQLVEATESQTAMNATVAQVIQDARVAEAAESAQLNELIQELTNAVRRE